METDIAEEQVNDISTTAFLPSTIRPSEFATFLYDNEGVSFESIFSKSRHCTNVITIQRRQYCVLSGSIPHCNSEKKFKNTIKISQASYWINWPSNKKVGFDPSLIPNVDINNGVIHEAFAITKDLFSYMLLTETSFYC